MKTTLPEQERRAGLAERVERSMQAVLRWTESHDYHGYEPSDGNLSPVHALTFEIPILERVLQQAIWKSPIDMRCILRVPPHRSTKGTGYMAWGYTMLFRQTGDAGYRDRARECLDWLIQSSARSAPRFAWGDHFPFSSRGGRRPAHEPTIVWSSLIGLAFLDAAETFEEERYLDVAVGVADWIKTLPRNVQPPGLCLGYTALGLSTIHNSNMLGAALLARVGALSNDMEALDLAAQAMEYSCVRQREDGSWPYAEAPRHGWIDSFHTGYNLDSLHRYITATGNRQFEGALRIGFDFFLCHFFEADGTPRYYHNRTHPIDIQCASQAIETLTLLAGLDLRALPLAEQVVDWALTHMQDSDGHFYYRDLGWKKVRTPMFHWGQATMCKALVQMRGALSAIHSGDRWQP